MKLKMFIKECARVLKITKKPTSLEFKTVIKVTSIGMAIIGFIGFVLTIAKQLMTL